MPHQGNRSDRAITGVWHFARAGSQKLSGQAAAGPGPLEVIAAAIAVYVQQLAAGVKARHQPALQSVGIKFRGVQPAGSDLGLVKAAGAGDGKGKMGGLPCNAPQVVPSEPSRPLIGKTGGFADHLSQTGVAGAGKEGRSLVGGHGRLPLGEPVKHLRLLPIGEEIEQAGEIASAGGNAAGEVENGRAAYAVLGEKYLAAIAGQHLAAPADGNAALGLHALQGPGIGGIGFQLYQRGIESRAVVAQALGQAIPVHAAAYLAAGGAAGSKVGGGMDGYRLAKSLGHHRTALYPSLVQLKTDPTYPRALKGVKAQCGISICRGSQVLARNSGEVLFTEYGVSGPAIFDLSRSVSAGGSDLTCLLNFFPDWEEAEVLHWLSQRQAAMAAHEASTLLTGSCHTRLGQMICKSAGFTNQRAAGLTRDNLRRIARQATHFALPITGTCGFDQAQVTAGGLDTSEFDPHTLQSRLVPGLYACGELLDIDGDCGGYNLQWAWSSGRLAGKLL